MEIEMYNNRYIIIDGLERGICSSSELKIFLLNGNEHTVDFLTFLLLKFYNSVTEEKHSFGKSQFSSPVPLESFQ